MADNPVPALVFHGNCPDCGQRTVQLPAALPAVGDDFDWQLRDFDSFRRFMLEELAAQYPDRRRWTAADLEVVLAEVLAFVLDQLSDMLDRVAAEGYLETARRPESVRRLLQLIGYDAIAQAIADGTFAAIAGEERSDRQQRFDRFWHENPSEMEAARLRGPREIHTQRRMVTLADHVDRLEEHPVVLRAHAYTEWGGAWTVVQVAVINWGRHALDEEGLTFPDELWAEIAEFHTDRGLPEPDRTSTTLRGLLSPYVDAYRLCGQEVVLRNAVEAPVIIAMSVQVNANYFQSEVRRAVTQALGTGPGGFFEPGRLQFGEDLHASDLYQTVMDLDGVDNVCLNRFKRLGDRYADMADQGRIVLEGLEVAVCDNDPARPDRGYFRLTLNGGRKG